MAVIELNPQTPTATETGRLFTPADYHLEVVDRQPYQEAETFDEGTVWFDEWHVLDHDTGITTRYHKLTGLPEAQTTDISMAAGTAWGTAERGHNLRNILRFMSAGIPAQLIGQPASVFTFCYLGIDKLCTLQ